MALRLVDPGTLIKHEDWNDLVAALQTLRADVDNLKAGGSQIPPRITQVLPTGPVTAGDTIRIFGANFDFSKGAQSVFFGSTRATTFVTGSSDSLLIVKLPDEIEGTTPGGASITMTVSNLVSFTTWAMTIRSKPILVTGGLEFAFISSAPPTPTQNQPIEFSFRLASLSNVDLTVTILPELDMAGASPDIVQVREGDQVRSDRRITLPSNATKTVGVRLTNVPVATGTHFNLRVIASAPGVQAITENVPEQVVGQAGEQPDATITNLEFQSVLDGNATFSAAGPGENVDGVISMAGGTTVTIALDATFGGIPAGTTNHYVPAAAIEPATAGWSTRVNPVGTPAVYDIVAPGAQKFPAFDITAPPTGGPVTVRITLTRQGAATGNRRSVVYRVQRS